MINSRDIPCFWEIAVLTKTLNLGIANVDPKLGPWVIPDVKMHASVVKTTVYILCIRCEVFDFYLFFFFRKILHGVILSCLCCLCFLFHRLPIYVILLTYHMTFQICLFSPFYPFRVVCLSLFMNSLSWKVLSGS